VSVTDWRAVATSLSATIANAGAMASFGKAILADLNRAGASYDAASAIQYRTQVKSSEVPIAENIALVNRVTQNILDEYLFRDELSRWFVESRAQILGLALNDPTLPTFVCGVNEGDPFKVIFGEGDPSAPPLLISHDRFHLKNDDPTTVHSLQARLRYILSRPEIQADATELEEMKALAAVPLTRIVTETTTVPVPTNSAPPAIVDALNAQLARAKKYITEFGP
jgi:hypothetical protein